VKSVQVRVAPVSVSEGENGTSGLVAVSGTTRLWRLWSNSMRRSLLSICGLEEESAETGELLGCAALVGLGLDAKDRIRSAAVITASMRRRVGGVFMVWAYCERFHLLLFYWDCQGNLRELAGLDLAGGGGGACQVHGSFVGSPRLRRGLRCLRMTISLSPELKCMAAIGRPSASAF
jgi:hypothetical protein